MQKYCVFFTNLRNRQLQDIDHVTADSYLEMKRRLHFCFINLFLTFLKEFFFKKMLNSNLVFLVVGYINHSETTLEKETNSSRSVVDISISGIKPDRL